MTWNEQFTFLFLITQPDCLPPLCHFPPSSHPALGITTTLKGNGCNTTPNRPCKLGRGAPCGTLKLIRWSREDKKRKSSRIASDLPTQTRGPAPNGRKEEGVTCWPRWSRKRSEMMGQHRRRWCDQVLFLKKSWSYIVGVYVHLLTWFEQIRFVPVMGVVVNRPHVDQNTCPLADNVASNATRDPQLFKVFLLYKTIRLPYNAFLL